MPKPKNNAASGRSSKHSNTIYVMAIIALVVASFTFIISITILRPEQDNMQMSVVVLGMLSTVTVAFIGFIKSNEAVAVTQETKEITIESKAIQTQTHDLMNSRMTEMIEVVRRLALAQGIEEGIETGRVREVKRAGEVEEGRAEGVETGIQQEVDRVEDMEEILEEERDHPAPDEFPPSPPRGTA